MGLTNSIWLVAALVIVERLGKALRSPSRDAVVSVVSKGMGSGKAFFGSTSSLTRLAPRANENAQKIWRGE